VVKDAAAKSLDDLQGKRLASNHLQDPRFVERVIFDGKIDPQKYFTLQPTSSPIKPFKQVDRGEADAALVDDSQLEHMKTLPFGGSLRVVYSSPPLPPFPLVAFTKTTSPAERESVRKLLLRMCGSPDGKEVCKSLTIGHFQPIDPAAFKSATTRYCKP
jgi:ABC-type phosphate/phosphonate transport system substrate-binding protein